MASISKQLRDTVLARSKSRFEYCLLSESHSDEPFWIDHVIAEQHAGPTTLENLAFCCMRCNRHKGPNLAGGDPLSGELAFLFNPRQDFWHHHFEWSGPALLVKTEVGRATIAALNVNHPSRMSARAALIAEGIFPPAEP